jgi:radical SAM protein with 4Fe4S-binding SPASM domain
MSQNTLERARNSKTFCIMPWIHQYVGTAGDVKPCCVYDHELELGNLKGSSLKEVWNNDETKTIRLKLLNGEVAEGCTRCNLMSEVSESHSSRANFNFRFFKDYDKYSIDAVKSTEPDGTVPEHMLHYMDVRFNNLCNFKCRTCSPHFSTSWIIDHRKLNPGKNINITKDNAFQYPGDSEYHAFNEMLPHLPSIRQVYFAGGEPLIQKQHYETLQKLVELNNTECNIVYNTNLSKLKLQGHDVIEYWKKFKHVSVLASIDGSYEKAEYWRSGTVWEDIVNNAKSIKQDAPHVKLHISYTLSWPNAFNIVDLHREWVELGLIDVTGLNINLLDGPYYYTLSVLPLWKKQQIEKVYRDHMMWIKSFTPTREILLLLEKFEHTIDFMYNGVVEHTVKDNLHHFHVLNVKLDAIRNEDFFSVFTEHQDLKEWMIENGVIR